LARFITRTVAGRTGEVVEAVLEAAGDLALEPASVDRRSGEIRLRQPYGRRGESHKLLVTVTDNGRGGSTLHASWDDSFPQRVVTRRAAIRLWQRTRLLVG
jgi:hypothetical protein